MDKSCDDCKWQFIPSPPGRDPGPGLHSNARCTHETEIQGNVPITRRLTRWMRSEEGFCGPDGVWWEAK